MRWKFPSPTVGLKGVWSMNTVFGHLLRQVDTKTQAAVAKQDTVMALWKRQTDTLYILHRIFRADGISKDTLNEWEQLLAHKRYALQDTFLFIPDSEDIHARTRQALKDFDAELEKLTGEAIQLERTTSPKIRAENIVQSFLADFEALKSQHRLGKSTEDRLTATNTIFGQGVAQVLTNGASQRENSAILTLKDDSSGWSW